VERSRQEAKPFLKNSRIASLGRGWPFAGSVRTGHLSRMRTLPTALLLGLAPLAALSGQQPDTIPTLPDLTVTVNRAPTGLATFGGAVTVLTGDGLQRQRLAVGLDEVLAFVPGVLAANRWNYSLDQRLVIRGFGARANFGVRGIKLLIDGVPQTLPDGQSQLTNLDLAQVERVEVLRGAASALHGNAAGGVVAFTTRTTPDLRGIAVDVGTEQGSFESNRVQARLAAGGERMQGALAVSRFATAGFRGQSRAEQQRVQGTLDLRLTPTLTALVRAAWADDPRADNPGALTAAEAAVTPSVAAPNNLRRNAGKAVQQGQVALGLDHRGTAWDAELRGWLVSRELTNPLAAPAPAPTTPDEGLWIGLDRRVLGVRGAVTRRFVGGARATAGLDVQAARDDRINRRHVGGTSFGDPLVDQEEAVREFGAFVQGDVPVRPGLAVRLGVRRDATTFEVTDALAATRSGARDLSATTAHAGLTLRHRATTAWLSVASAFETPTTTELANRPDGTTGLNTVLGPQRSRTLELGTRTRFGGVAVDAAAWHTTTDDAITPFQEVGGRSFFVNAGATRTRGVELALVAPLGGGWSGLATWTHTDAVFTRYSLIQGDVGLVLDGNQVAGIPRHLARIGVRGTAAGVTVDLDHAVSSSLFADDLNTIAVAGWGVGVTGVRLSTERRLGASASVSPFVAVQNLFARRYVGSVTVNGGFGRVFEPSPGRVISFGLRTRVGPAR
jgi:iron complex outermembrane receptor protein